MKYVRFEGGPGYSYEGEVLGEVQWDGVRMYVVRYWFDPNGDPPRKPYTLIGMEQCTDILPTPEYTKTDF